MTERMSIIFDASKGDWTYFVNSMYELRSLISKDDYICVRVPNSLRDLAERFLLDLEITDQFEMLDNQEPDPPYSIGWLPRSP